MWPVMSPHSLEPAVSGAQSGKGWARQALELKSALSEQAFLPGRDRERRLRINTASRVLQGMPVRWGAVLWRWFPRSWGAWALSWVPSADFRGSGESAPLPEAALSVLSPRRDWRRL